MAPPGEIAFVALWSKDLGSQRRFFVELMGYELQQESDDAVVVSGSGTTIVLQKAVGDVAHLNGQTHIGFFVDSIDDWARYLSATGTHVLSLGADIGDGQRTIVVQAPGGQTFALVGP